MRSFFLLPYIFVKFWFIEAPLGMVSYFSSLNHAFLEMFSLPLFLRTFFQPLKSEYRDGLVWFSRIIGMIIKSFFILFDTVIFIIILAFEGLILVGFLTFPIATIFLLYGK